jgi:hypothetical protein
MRENIFSHAGTSLGEKLEETASPEEIEIGSVEAGYGIGALCLLTVADPAIFDAGQASAVDIGCAFGKGSFAKDICVVDGDRDKCG